MRNKKAAPYTDGPWTHQSSYFLNKKDHNTAHALWGFTERLERSDWRCSSSRECFSWLHQLTAQTPTARHAKGFNVSERENVRAARVSGLTGAMHSGKDRGSNQLCSDPSALEGSCNIKTQDWRSLMSYTHRKTQMVTLSNQIVTLRVPFKQLNKQVTNIKNKCSTYVFMYTKVGCS